MNPNLTVYYIINCPIPPKIAIENRYQIDFGNPVSKFQIQCFLEVGTAEDHCAGCVGQGVSAIGVSAQKMLVSLHAKIMA